MHHCVDRYERYINYKEVKKVRKDQYFYDRIIFPDETKRKDIAQMLKEEYGDTISNDKLFMKIDQALMNEKNKSKQNDVSERLSLVISKEQNAKFDEALKKVNKKKSEIIRNMIDMFVEQILYEQNNDI